VQLFIAIFIKCCAKCKSVIKKYTVSCKKYTTKLFQLSSILVDYMDKSYMTD